MASGSPEFYKTLVESVSDGVYFVDTERRITYWNPAAERISGYSKEEMVGQSCPHGRLVHCDAAGKLLCNDGCPLEAVLHGDNPDSCQIFMRCKDGSRIPVFISASPVMSKEGLVVGVAEIFRDNSSTLSALDEALHANDEAYLDALTGVGNRRFAEFRIPQLISMARSPRRPGALLFLDVDEFKKVNDTYGHGAGDQVLRTVARTLSHTLRSHDVVCRWGGEEFLVYLGGVNGAEMLDVAQRCRVLVANSCSAFESNRIAVTCSIGATLIQQGDSMDELVARADRSMYEAKRQGRNRVCAAMSHTLVQLFTSPADDQASGHFSPA